MIVIDHLWGRWMLPTCSNVPYTTALTIVCLVWPLEASKGPNEPKSVFLGCSQSDIIVVNHFWDRWTLPSCSNMPYTTSIPTIVCLVCSLEASRGPKRPKSAQMSVFGRMQVRMGRACVAQRPRRSAPAALGACGAWRLRRLAPAALGACDAERLRRLSLRLPAFPVWVGL
jgi:hypothetical protein